jgi:hypothetical protein
MHYECTNVIYQIVREVARGDDVIPDQTFSAVSYDLLWRYENFCLIRFDLEH